MSSQGWELGKAECVGRQVRLEWRHREGGDFINLPDNGKISPKNGKIATSTRAVTPLPSLTKRPDGPGTDHEMLVAQDAASGLLSQIAQDTGTKLELKFATQTKKSIDGISVVSPWHVGTWSLSSVPDLLMGVGGEDGLFEMLAEVPGLTIESIGYDSGNWFVEGKIYAAH